MNKSLVFSAAVVLGLAGCGEIPYRKDGFAANPDCRSLYNRIEDVSDDRNSAQEKSSPCWLRAREERDDYDLLFVEFDDQGWVRDSFDLARPAKEDFLDTFYKQLKQLYDDNRDNGLSLVVFVHGWHHNAGAEDRNVTNFRRLVRDVSVAEKLMNAGKGPRVVGIYVGWRGESITVPYLNNITFWDRKNTAERVSQGSVRELFARLDFLRDRGRTGVKFDALSRKDEPGEGRRNVRMLTIGHSFGGLITYEALSSEFLRAASRSTGDDYVSRLGDLVVIVNPAFEGARYEPLMAAGQRIARLKPNQLPVVIVATSRADWATRGLFPLARWFSTFLERTPGQEDDAIVYAVGHNARYRTHSLAPCGEGDTGCAGLCKGYPAVQELAKGGGTSTEQLRAEFDLMKGIGSKGFNAQGKEYLCGNLRLTGTDNWKPDKNPFWVVSTEKELMADHNDIFNPLFISFVRQMYFSVISERFK